MSRPLWDDSHTIPLGVDLISAPNEEDWSDFARLGGLPLLTLEALRTNIETCLGERDFVLLTEVLERFPATQGVLEVIGYLILAAHPPHYYTADQHDDLELGDGVRWRFPRVMFCRPIPPSAAA